MVFSVPSVLRCNNRDGLEQRVQFFVKGGTMKEGKEKQVLILNKYMAMGPSGARWQEWSCWLVAGSKLLLCSALLSVQ
jgi:hypothetical protein